MKNITRPLLTVAIALATAPVLSQERTPVSSITNATWAQYSGEYQQSPLCSKKEITLWSCKTGKRVYSLCSSQTVTRTSGYIQYRASSSGKVVLTYPTDRKPPLGSFIYNSFANGDASIEFKNNGYEYTLVDPIRKASSINVSAPIASDKQTTINCGGNQTLQVNYTMRLMYDSGVWASY
jgi:hypothetical protein